MALALLAAMLGPSAASGAGAAEAQALPRLGPDDSSIKWSFAEVDSVNTKRDQKQFELVGRAAILTVRIDWNSPDPAQIDLFTVSPSPTDADHDGTNDEGINHPACPSPGVAVTNPGECGTPSGPGVPATGGTGPQHSTITIHDPRPGIWTVVARAGLVGSTPAFSTPPTVAHATATLTLDPKQAPGASAELPESDGPFEVVPHKGVIIPVQPTVSLTADLYVPDADGASPVVLIAPGGLSCNRDKFANWGPHMASRGFIVVVPGRRNCDHRLPDPQDPQDLLRVLRWMIAQNTTSGHFLQGRVDTARLSMVGHSYGGHNVTVATELSQSEGPALAAVAVSDSPSDLYNMPSGCEDRVSPIKVPLAVYLSGVLSGWPDDTGPKSCLFDQHAGPKFGMMVNYSGHCEFEDPTLYWACFPSSDSPYPLQPPNPEHQRMFHRYVTAWLGAWLQCDAEALPYINGSASQRDQEQARIWVLNGSSEELGGLPASCATA